MAPRDGSYPHIPLYMQKRTDDIKVGIAKEGLEKEEGGFQRRRSKPVDLLLTGPW